MLANLYLSNNDLTVLEENIFQDLTTLKTLDLRYNPLTCCELLDLKLFLQNKNLGDAGAMCHGTSTMLVDFNFTDCTESGVRTTMETTTDALASSPNTFETTVITTQATQSTSTVTMDTPTQESDVRTTMETTIDALASTPNTVEITVITTQATQSTSTVTMDTPTQESDVRTTMETTTDALASTPNTVETTVITTQATQSTSTVTMDTPTQESDVRTTMETTTDALASTPNTVETTVITTQDTPLTSTVSMDTPTADNIPLNTTSSNAGSRSEDNNSAIIAGTVTGALVVLFVIALFVIQKLCCTSAETKQVHPSI